MIFQCWFSRRISLPTRNHGGNGQKRWTQRAATRKWRRRDEIRRVFIQNEAKRCICAKIKAFSRKTSENKRIASVFVSSVLFFGILTYFYIIC
ncbi:hypothetical protein D3Z48_18550 [Clostridiaceae bacterium]|nr:hypothetical protein [Clostridiaceae bacterium]